jgi:hypothetical protein
MKVVIDLDLHEAIADFTIRSAASTYEFKSQDTVEWMIYFVRGGLVQDLGPSMALKYGMIATGDTSNTLLGYQATFNYLTDSDGNVYYAGLANYNNSAMASAISGKSQLPCTSEIRFQDPDNEIIHSLDISCLVFQTILVETGAVPPPPAPTYPDPSTLVLKSTIHQPNGVAGLDSGGFLFTSQIPVDGTTVVISSAGKIASGSILAATSANFTTPASGGTVSVAFVSTTNLKAGQYVRIPIAGFYSVQSVTDATDAVLQNIGDPLNASSGTTITSGAPLLPAQAVSGGGTGQAAYTTTTAAFTTPAIGATVTVPVVSTAWMGGTGYWTFITGAGYYAVSAIVDTTHVTLTNGGGSSNAPPGSNIASGTLVAVGGAAGANGATGPTGLSAYDATSAAFTMPAAGASVPVTITSTAWLGTNQVVYIAGAGYMSVATILSATQFNAQNLNYQGNAASGTSVPAGVRVSPGGFQGPQGAGGAGLNAYTNLATTFTQPAVNAAVSINVGSSAWVAPGEVIFVQGGGYYQVASVPDLTHVSATNLGYIGNAAPGASVTGGSSVLVTPGGLAGQGGNSFTTTTASYTQPAIGSNVTVTFVNTSWMVQNQYIFVNGGGTYQVVNINDSAHAILQSLAATGNVVSGSTVPGGSGVSPAGPPGPQGAIGATGPSGGISDAPSDGTTYGRKNAAWVAVTGGTGPGWDPQNGLFFSDDFTLAGVAGPVNDPRYALANGTGATFVGSSSYGQNATLKVLGAVEFNTGTNASNTGCGLTWGGLISPDYGGVVYNLGVALTFKTRIFIETALPATGGGYAFRTGLGRGLGSMYYNPPVQGFYFEYSPDNNSGQWRVAVGGASPAYSNTSIAAAADTAYALEIDVNAAWTSIAFLINGTVAATITTGIPTTFGFPLWQYVKGSSGTVAQKAAIDSWSIYYPVTR